MFGDTDYNPSCSYSSVSIEEQLQALSIAVREGKVIFHIVYCNFITLVIWCYQLLISVHIQLKYHNLEGRLRTATLNLLWCRLGMLV